MAVRDETFIEVNLIWVECGMGICTAYIINLGWDLIFWIIPDYCYILKLYFNYTFCVRLSLKKFFFFLCNYIINGTLLSFAMVIAFTITTFSYMSHICEKYSHIQPIKQKPTRQVVFH